MMRFLTFLALALLLPFGQARAQGLDIGVVTGNEAALPIAVVPMPLKEFELLELLLRKAGRVLTRGQLIDRVWGIDYVGDTKTLDVHIKRLRAKVDDPYMPKLIHTVRGWRAQKKPGHLHARARSSTHGVDLLHFFTSLRRRPG